jgi:hypothetical protein
VANGIINDGVTRQVTLLPGDALSKPPPSFKDIRTCREKYATYGVHLSFPHLPPAEAVETIEDKVHSAAQSGNGLNLPLMRYRYALEGRQRLDTQ